MRLDPQSSGVRERLLLANLMTLQLVGRSVGRQLVEQ